MKNNYFIIGTGRSGTHWLGHILEESSEINVQIEDQPIFKWVTQAAINKNKRKYLLPLIILYYYKYTFFSKKHFVDKSHPNLWLADHLIRYIPKSYFIGIIRNPYATISSMLLHRGVLGWIKNWEDYPVPNEFLGIEKNNTEQYSAMSLEEKCAMRWKAHKKMLEEIKNKYPGRTLIVNYDDLIENTGEEMARLNSFLEIDKKLPMPNVKVESKDKWKEKLTKDQIDNINKILSN